MTTLQEPPSPPLLVICDFFFEQTGPPGIATYDGDTYPYLPLPSDKGSDYRYAWGTTPVFLAVEFFGIAHEVESKTQPHVIAPPGISILEYLWDFGDGYTGYGPIVTHTYEVPDPTTAISLTVIDSLGREFSTSKALSLVIVDFGYIYQRIRGRNTEVKFQEVEASGDFALSNDQASFEWLANNYKTIRQVQDSALSNDSVKTQTSWIRKATDKSLTSDSVKTQTSWIRKATDKSLTSDVALEPLVTRPKTYAELENLFAKYENVESHYGDYEKMEAPIRVKQLKALLSFLGNLTHKP
jgi:hypothetical protein